jgi:hypothetical protein
MGSSLPDFRLHVKIKVKPAPERLKPARLGLVWKAEIF